jgi:UDP-N-acetylmuramoyl-tripeptide--D-alanyl-D-alanine ligase
MRQNIVKKGNNTVIIDCYNASPDSMKATLAVLSGIKTTGRKIAVLGDMLELGQESEKLHRMIGKFASDAKPDMVFCYGNDAKYICEEAEKHGTQSWFTDNKDKLTEKLKEFIKPDDIILFKASRGMKLEEVIEKMFG